MLMVGRVTCGQVVKAVRELQDVVFPKTLRHVRTCRSCGSFMTHWYFSVLVIKHLNFFNFGSFFFFFLAMYHSRPISCHNSTKPLALIFSHVTSDSTWSFIIKNRTN